MKPLIVHLGLLLSLSLSADAATIVVAPNVGASDQGGYSDSGPFGTDDWTKQWIFGASQFLSVPIGSSINAIGFRLESFDDNSPAAPFTLPSWNLQLSSSPNGVGSLARNFAANLGADAVTVLSGPLTIPANAFANSGDESTPNPFYMISFTTSYTYTGGDLLFTLRKQGAGPGLWVDASTAGDGYGDTVGQGTFTATRGTAHFYNYPVTALSFSVASPEPSSWVLLGSALVGLMSWRRRRG